MKKLLLVGLLIGLFAIFAFPTSMALNNNGGLGSFGGPDKTFQIYDITPTELPMSINCTWTYPWPQWDDVSTLPPLPGSGWADSIVSLTLDGTRQVDLYITDAWYQGDYFEVYEVDGLAPTQARLIGATPWVQPNGAGTVGDPDLAFNDPSYSHGIFHLSLSTGTYYFAFREVGHNFGGGGFFVKVCISNPVGGFVESANSFALLAPYLAFIIAALAASTLLVLKIRYRY
jgi:hypothetical protein